MVGLSRIFYITRGIHARGSWFDFLKLGGVENGWIPESSLRLLPPVLVIARETKFLIRADGFYVTSVIILPNVSGQRPEQLARSVRSTIRDSCAGSL
jgi:hypothetical protein